MPLSRVCPNCKNALTLVPIFSTFAEECLTCGIGPPPKGPQGRVGARGTMAALVHKFGLGFTATWETWTVTPVKLDFNAQGVICKVFGGRFPEPDYVWPGDNQDILEIIG